MNTATRRAIWERAANCCEKCGVPAVEMNGQRYGLTIHHVTAQRHGGDHTSSNLLLLCADCHRQGNIEANAHGRPRKPKGKKFVNWPLRWPPQLLAEIHRQAPEGQMALFVRRAVCRGMGLPEEMAGEEGDANA